jgi:3-methyladenine DNA glycosylase AlkD
VGTSPREAVDFFRRLFRSIGTQDRARQEKAYLKSALRFHGVTLPELRRAVREYDRAHPDLVRARLVSIVDALYATDYHDLRSAGIGLLERRTDLLTPRDVRWLVGLVRRSANWAHVDWLAASILGDLFDEHPALLRGLPALGSDPDFWVRRTSLLVQLRPLREGRGDFALFEELAVPMLDEKEFFIRKAIGWVLREVSKKRPRLVRGFVRRHRELMSGLTLREATKYL